MADEQDATTPYHVKVGSGAYRIDRGSGDEQDRRVDAAAQALKAEFRRLNPAWFVDDARNDGPCDMTPWNLLAEAAIRAEGMPPVFEPGGGIAYTPPGDYRPCVSGGPDADGMVVYVDVPEGHDVRVWVSGGDGDFDPAAAPPGPLAVFEPGIVWGPTSPDGQYQYHMIEDADPGAAHEPDPLEARVIALEARVAAIEAGKAWGGRNRFLEYFDGSVDP